MLVSERNLALWLVFSTDAETEVRFELAGLNKISTFNLSICQNRLKMTQIRTFLAVTQRLLLRKRSEWSRLTLFLVYLPETLSWFAQGSPGQSHLVGSSFDFYTPKISPKWTFFAISRQPLVRKSSGFHWQVLYLTQKQEN